MNTADTCRTNGWLVGTVLEGTNAQGETHRIRITEIKDYSVSAIDEKGQEAAWTLTGRKWTALPPGASVTGRLRA